MEKLNFVFNGEYWMARSKQAIKDRRMRLSRENWKKPEDIVVEGAEGILDLFDLKSEK